MQYSLERLSELFASKLRKEGAEEGDHDVIFHGRIWHCRYDGTGVTIIPDRRKEKSYDRYDGTGATIILDLRKEKSHD